MSFSNLNLFKGSLVLLDLIKWLNTNANQNFIYFFIYKPEFSFHFTLICCFILINPINALKLVLVRWHNWKRGTLWYKHSLDGHCRCASSAYFLLVVKYYLCNRVLLKICNTCTKYRGLTGKCLMENDFRPLVWAVEANVLCVSHLRKKKLHVPISANAS